jgi:hypothetical protein
MAEGALPLSSVPKARRFARPALPPGTGIARKGAGQRISLLQDRSFPDRHSFIFFDQND